MTAFLLSSESSQALTKAVEKKIGTAISDIETIASIENLPSGTSAIKIVAIVPFTNIESIGKFIDIATRRRDGNFFILVSKEISASDYKALVRSEGADWISADGSVQEILEIMARQTQTRTNSPAPSRQSTVITFLPSSGGVGNTTIALEVAIHNKLAKGSRSSRACYVDLDFQTSHVCDFLDLEPRLQIQEILDQPERLDQQLFELFASHHSSGLDVFAAPRSQMDLCAVNLRALDLFLGMISRNYDFIVVDLPVFWLGWTIPILENSDAIVVTGFNTIPGLRQLKSTIEAVAQVKNKNAETSIVLNRVKRDLFGRIERRTHADNVLGGQRLFFVREDPDAVNRLNAGVSAAHTNTGRSVKDIVAIASYCAGIKKRREEVEEVNDGTRR